MADILGSLRDEFRQSGRSRGSRLATRRLSERHPDIDLTFQNDLCDVVDLCTTTSSRNVLERAEIVNALLAEANDPDIHRALLQTLLPGVVQVCRELQFGRGIIDERECVTLAVSMLSELLVDWAGESRQYAAPDILSALRGRLRRCLLKEKAATRFVSQFDEVDIRTKESSTLQTRLESLLGGDCDRQIQLVYRCVFAGDSMSKIQRDEGKGVKYELQSFAANHLI